MNKLATRAATIGTTAGVLALSAAPAFADVDTPPDASAAVTHAGSLLSGGVIDTTVSLIPYAVPVLLLAWGYSTAKNMIGTRKKAAK